jgi:hypothetical protein
MVTVQARGSLSLNEAAYKLLIGPDRHPPKKHPRSNQATDFFVELFFDRKSQSVALKWAQPDVPDSYIVRKHPHSNTFLCSAKGFLKHYAIRPAKAKRYSARMYGPDMLIFSVSDKKK